MQDRLLNLRRSPTWPTVDEIIADIATNVAESCIIAVSDDDVDWDLEGADGFDTVERVGVKRRLETLQDSCRTIYRKVPSTVAEPVALADELVHQIGESGIQAENPTSPGTVPVAETDTVPLTGNFDKARQEAINARAVLDKLRALAESTADEHQAMFVNVCKEWRAELDSLRAAKSQCEVVIAEVRERTLADEPKMWSARDSVAARHHELFVSIRRIGEVREKSVRTRRLALL